MDYAAMEEERVMLLSKLKAAGGSAGLDAAAAAKAEAKAGGSQHPLVLRAKVPTQLDSAVMSSISGSFGAGLGGSLGIEGRPAQLTVPLVLSNTTKSSLQVSAAPSFEGSNASRAQGKPHSQRMPKYEKCTFAWLVWYTGLPLELL